MKLLAPILSHMQLFEASRTCFEPPAIIWSFCHLSWASCNYLKLPAPFFEPLAIIWSFLHHIRASWNYLKLLMPSLSLLQIFEPTYTYFEVPPIRWSYLHLFWATCNYLKHFQLFEASNTYFRSYLHIFCRATCNYLKIRAPYSSLLKLFEAFNTYFDQLATIWSFLHQFRATYNYLKLLTTCNYLKYLTSISSLLQ